MATSPGGPCWWRCRRADIWCRLAEPGSHPAELINESESALLAKDGFENEQVQQTPAHRLLEAGHGRGGHQPVELCIPLAAASHVNTTWSANLVSCSLGNDEWLKRLIVAAVFSRNLEGRALLRLAHCHSGPALGTARSQDDERGNVCGPPIKRSGNMALVCCVAWRRALSRACR